MSGPDVVVLGGGLAGVAAATALAKHQLPVVLVDRNDYHQFQPMLYQVATAQLPAEDIARPLRSLFADHPSVEVVTAPVETAKLSDRSLTLADGSVRSGDYLVVAAGARPNFFGIPGAAQHSFPLYSVADAERLRLHLQLLLRPDDGPGPLDVVIVGAGATGVETAGATAELLRAFAREGLLRRPAQVVLVDRGKALLPQFSEKAHDYAFEKLTQVGVQVRLGVGVAAVREDGVDLDDGTSIATSTVVWAGGETASEFVQAAGLPPGRGGRIDVQPDLRVPGLPGVYAVGDVANIPSGDHGGEALPQLGSVAQQAGGWAAANILREIDGKEPQPFRYRDKGIMAMIGRNAAVAEVGRHRHQVEGPLAFAAWLGVHAMLLSGSHSKTDAFLSWAWDYFDRDHAAVVDSHAAPQRIAWGDKDTDVPHINLDRPGS